MWRGIGTEQFEFCVCALVRVAVGPPGLTGQGCHCFGPAGFPEADVRLAPVVFLTNSTDEPLSFILFIQMAKMYGTHTVKKFDFGKKDFTKARIML